MLGFVRRLFGRRDPFGYKAPQREIFAYHDGVRARRGDPLAIHRALAGAPDFDLDTDPMVAAVPTKDGLWATGRTAAAVRFAFQLPPFDAGGLTDRECLALFLAFGEYVGRLMDNASPLRSGPKPSPASAPPADSRTEPSAASA